MGLGDQHQAIYGFMNLVNGFELLEDDAVILSLTKSFRCSEAIADRVEFYGKQYLDTQFTFEGTGSPEADGKTMYITATNAMIISRLVKLHESNTGYILTRPLKDIFACPLALVTALAGKKVMHKQYKFLDREYKNYTLSPYKSFYQYLNKTVGDQEIKNSIKLLLNLKEKNINIFDVLAKAKTMKKDPNLIVGTYFSLKGLGAETVYIEDDLNNQVLAAIEATKEAEYDPDVFVTEDQRTALKGGYVGCTRARINLQNCEYL
jgi:hypothetical protein